MLSADLITVIEAVFYVADLYLAFLSVKFLYHLIVVSQPDEI